uniref:Phosphofructokinase domain-containing protein n=1 Tax=Palpitomonas bilix TaxID=652834 RepID=A0A7S3GFH9_9EUKA
MGEIIHTVSSIRADDSEDEDEDVEEYRQRMPLKKVRGFIRAGARAQIAWRPDNVKVAIVTCGGLCPGLNNVVRELVRTLHFQYGVNNVWGVPYGYRGAYNGDEWIELHPRLPPLKGSHKMGGTVIGTSRGGSDTVKIVDALEKKGVNMFFIIGGEGTHLGAEKIYEEVKKRKLKIGVIGIPKTIDNDIEVIDRSFGFDTAVHEAVRAIHAARVESKSHTNGVGIVKLMGRDSGFITAHATLASGDVSLCLMPEAPFTKDEVLKYVEAVLKKKGNCVIVVAEGAGQDHLLADGGVDESGNKHLSDIGPWLCSLIKDYFKTAKTLDPQPTIKYIDPSYTIRSVPPMSSDALYCNLLAQQAAHGAMAGFTGFTVGLVNNRTVYLPFSLVNRGKKQVRMLGRTTERISMQTGFMPASIRRAAHID